MITDCWDQELVEFAALDCAQRSQWLACLASALTIAARDTYEVGGDDLLDPKRMRRFNELLHRTTSQLQSQLRNDPGFPDGAFLLMIREETAALGVIFPMLRKLM